MSTKQNDRRCTCSNNIVSRGRLKPDSDSKGRLSSSSNDKVDPSPRPTNMNSLEGSFLVDDYVHLPLSSLTSDNTDSALRYQSPDWNNDQYSSFQEINLGNNDVAPSGTRHAGFLDLVQHMSTLVQLGEGRFSSWESPLCYSCVERVANSVEENNKRILSECEAYDDAVKSEEDKVCRMKAVHSTLSMSQTASMSAGAGAALLHPLHTEMQSLQDECQTLEQEIKNLGTAIKYEDKKNTVHLKEMEDSLFHDFNSLELTNITYRNCTRTLASEYKSTQKELELLSNVSLRSLLFQIEENVFTKAGRYDMINGLRLGFRPKKDLHWREINAAWSLATQLIMFVGEIINFPWKELRVVPLTTCSKIIEMNQNNKIVHHLGKELYDGTHRSSNTNNDEETITPEAILSFHSLLYSLVSLTHKIYQDIIQHESNALSFMSSLSLFPMEKNKIGMHDLSTLKKTDDDAWCAVLHCMVVNMKWAMECATSCVTYEFDRYVPYINND